MAAYLEFKHDAVVCCDAAVIMVGLEGFNEDDIAIAVVSEHDILVAAVRADVETAHGVS